MPAADRIVATVGDGYVTVTRGEGGQVAHASAHRDVGTRFPRAGTPRAGTA
jgi:hypothetical protein